MAGLGENIRKFREQRGMKQLDLAVAAGVDTSMVSRAETGKMALVADSLRSIATALGVTLAELLDDRPNVQRVPMSVPMVPLLDQVQAGAWKGVYDVLGDQELREFIPAQKQYSDKAFAMRLIGDSMEPDFLEGDMLIIDPGVAPRPGDFVVAINKAGDATFKRYRSRGLNADGVDVFELLPSNLLYPPMRSDRTYIQVVGVMVEFSRCMRR